MERGITRKLTDTNTAYLFSCFATNSPYVQKMLENKKNMPKRKIKQENNFFLYTFPQTILQSYNLYRKCLTWPFVIKKGYLVFFLVQMIFLSYFFYTHTIFRIQIYSLVQIVCIKVQKICSEALSRMNEIQLFSPLKLHSLSV